MIDGKWWDDVVTQKPFVFVAIFTVYFIILSINSRESRESDCTLFHSGFSGKQFVSAPTKAQRMLWKFFAKEKRKMNKFQEKENAEGHEIVSPVLC